MNQEDSFSIVCWYSDISMNIIFYNKNFIVEIKSLPKGSQIKGITYKLRIEGYGHGVWITVDTNWKLRHLRVIVPCYYIPNLQQRTLIFSKIYHKNKNILVSDAILNASENPSDTSESAIDIITDPDNNLPTSTCFRHSDITTVIANYIAFLSSSHKENSYCWESPSQHCIHFGFSYKCAKTVPLVPNPAAGSIIYSAIECHFFGWLL